MSVVVGGQRDGALIVVLCWIRESAKIIRKMHLHQLESFLPSSVRQLKFAPIFHFSILQLWQTMGIIIMNWEKTKY
jgi:hypothetical protein